MKGVNLYMFHPGGVHATLIEEYMPPGSVEMAIDSLFLPGGVVWFASEVADLSVDRAWLSGRHISANWDIDEILAKKEDIVEKAET
jgi:hypothetical protein